MTKQNPAMAQPKSDPPNPSASTTSRRHVTVDGLQYALLDGRRVPLSNKVKPAEPPAAPASEKPPTEDIYSSGRKHLYLDDSRRPVRDISRPQAAEKSPTSLPVKSRSIWQRIRSSFSQPIDRQSLDGAFLSGLLTPWFWLSAAAPWAILASLNGQFSSNRAYRLFRSFISLPIETAGMVLGGVIFLGWLLWIARRTLQLGGLGLQIRANDKRTHTRARPYIIALSKVWRLSLTRFLSGLAILLPAAALVATVSLISTRQSTITTMFGSGVALFVLIVTTFMIIWGLLWRLLMTHLVAVSEHGFVVVAGKSLGLEKRSLHRLLGFGAFWTLTLLVASAVMALLIWATVSYGQYTIGRTPIARALLTLFSTFLTYGLVVSYQVWSQNYWALVYRAVVTQAYPLTLSTYMVAEPVSPSSRRNGILQLAIVGLLILAVMSWAVFAYGQPLQAGRDNLLRRMPLSEARDSTSR